MKKSMFRTFGVCAAWYLTACGQGASSGDVLTSPTATQSASSSTLGAQTSTSFPGTTSVAVPNVGPTSDDTSDVQTSAPRETSTGVVSNTSGTPTRPQGTGSASSDDSSGSPEASSSEPSGVSSSPDVTSAPPEVTSDVPAGDDPLLADPICSSDTYWMRGEGTTMRPGEACVACHTAEREGPMYSIAGTLYPTGHEPDDCNGAGAESGATIVITDANGQVHELTPNQAGNFYYNGNLAKPYTAKVVTAAGEREMLSPQQNGDCNECHSADGATGAPGRVVVPF